MLIYSQIIISVVIKLLVAMMILQVASVDVVAIIALVVDIGRYQQNKQLKVDFTQNQVMLT